MEAWAQDLASALDESSHFHVKAKLSKLGRINIKVSHNSRRLKSAGNLVENIVDTSSSEGEMYEFNENVPSSVQQTETDDGSTREKMRNPNAAKQPCFAVPSLQNSVFGNSYPVKVNTLKISTQQPSLAESDSLNETISPMRPYTRRKRRFKRMAVDPEPSQQNAAEIGVAQEWPIMSSPQKGFSFSTFASSSIFAKPRQKKTRKKPVDIQKVPQFSIGKRKRSTRERSIECELEKISLNSSPEDDVVANLSTASGSDLSHSNCHMNSDSMDLDAKQIEQVSSSSVSGSESDPGFYTNDDGREADDEQSDWYQESGPTWGVAGIKSWWEKDSSHEFRFRTPEDDIEGEEVDDSIAGEEKKFNNLLKGSWKHLSDEAKDAYRLRMQKLRDRIPGREIRAGRRHLGEQRGPSFSILTSANEKLSRFLQDPAQSELRLHPMQKSERDQLSHLAALYSLQMLSEGARGLKCPVLKKTSNTMQAVRIDMDRSPSLWSDFKRQKKTPPASVTSESTLEEAPVIDEDNVGSQILKSMGWTPGTGLGARNQGRISPVRAVVRPKRIGLGHSESPESTQLTESEVLNM